MQSYSHPICLLYRIFLLLMVMDYLNGYHIHVRNPMSVRSGIKKSRKYYSFPPRLDTTNNAGCHTFQTNTNSKNCIIVPQYTSAKREQQHQTIVSSPYQTSSRKDFNQKLLFSLAYSFSGISPCLAFEGGVGGLGKTKPQTGVTFYNPEQVSSQRQSLSTPGIYSAEIIGPDNIPILISFYAPWPMLKSDGIESRDLTSTESAFIQVAPRPLNLNDSTTTSTGSSSSSSLPREFFEKSILSLEGKYGMYGLPTGIKVSKIHHDSNSQIDLYALTFTTMTPAMRESDRKVYVSTKIIGNGVYMLVTGTTVARFKGQEPLLRKVAESFECIEAPKSQIRGKEY